jgi:carbon monoxide dehydrogenase subunit G
VKIERDIELGVTPERAYEAVMDPHHLADWVSIHEGFKEEPPGRLDEGATLVQKLKVAGQGFTVRWTVTEAERPTLVRWEGKGPAGTKALVEYRFEPDGDGRTHFAYLNEYDLPGGPAGKLAGRAISGAAGREVDRSLERLKQTLEK